MWIDGVAAAALLAVALVQIWTSAPAGGRLVATAVTVAVALGVAVRRRWLPWALCLVVAAVAARLAVAGIHGAQEPSGVQGSLMGLLLFYGAGAYLEGPAALMALVMGVAITSVDAASVPGAVASNLVWDDLVIAGLPWFVGHVVRDRGARARAARERAERLDSEHEMHMRVAALAERTRLAREIHDVIAHSVSVMVIQAGGARAVMDADPLRAEEALRFVERAGREALAEMRRLLGVLGEGKAMRELAPQPGIEDLDGLIGRARQAGLAASMSVTGQPVTVPPGLSLCAYRVVQEALTNTIKHAGARRADVTVRWRADALELEVADDGRSDESASALGDSGGGHGIIGMRERAALHGGHVEIGPRPGGGFAVRARIPLDAVAVA